MDAREGRDSSPGQGPILVILLFALVKLGLHTAVSAGGGYGYFRDELYYLACAARPDWGYVDQPPLSILLLTLVRAVAGDGLVALRFIPGLAGALTLTVAGFTIRRLGGGIPALCLALTGILVAPVLLAMGGYYSMNALDILAWTVLLGIITEILRGGSPRLWLAVGVVAGLGLQNKYSVGFLVGGVVLGLLLTRERARLATRWFWIGMAAALLLFIPHLLWQVLHGWPALEFMENARTMKNLPLAPVQFVLGLVMDQHPLALPVWLAGTVALLLGGRFRSLRPLGIAFWAVLLFFMTQAGKVYYLSPFLPFLLAAGGVALEGWLPRKTGRWALPAYSVLLLAGGLGTLPMALPVLPVQSYLAYQEALGVTPEVGERTRVGRLPQHYADMFGWEEKAAAVERAWRSLPPGDRERCVIFSDNYGRCGAIDFFGGPRGLPPAIGRHNNYWLWGPGTRPGDIVIVLGNDRENLEELFAYVQRFETVMCDLCMPYESDVDVFICRKPKQDLRSVWPRLKLFI